MTVEKSRSTPSEDRDDFAAATTGPITALDVWNFAVGIIERFQQAAPTEITDEARMLHALARDYYRLATPPERASRV